MKVLILMLLLSASMYAQDATVDPPIHLSDQDESIYQATSGRYVYRVWTEVDSGLQLKFQRSTDSGQTWEKSQTLAREATVRSLTVKAVGNRVYVTYRRGNLARWDPAPTFHRSDDYGETFERVDLSSLVPPRDMTDGILPLEIHAIGAKIFVAWNGCRPQSGGDCLGQRNTVYLAFSTDGGQNWQLVDVSEGRDSGTDRLIRMVPADPGIYVFYRKDVELFVRYIEIQ